eukprot:10328448-Ditylum_brightwellii.AAC.1
MVTASFPSTEQVGDAKVEDGVASVSEVEDNTSPASKDEGEYIDEDEDILAREEGELYAPLDEEDDEKDKRWKYDVLEDHVITAMCDVNCCEPNKYQTYTFM